MAFELPIRVYWEDTDAGGIVFYANYLKYFERARTEWLRALGIGQWALREEAGGMFVVADAALKYRRPARLDDELLVTAQLQSSGRTALVVQQQAWLKPGTVAADAAQPALLCEGSIRIGWVEAESMKPARIPSAILEKLNP
ncbi:YbgC/FadM family acyl-CoA thioesterase [Ottowia sp. GY511]|uniref:YbgC/FadM family acyl-CoA thioesterase n=1 Tax=Ottowia flava TaxID=2675430 RepID=A0ABW4KVU7_9BURK|nr:YbgC/FadM family acyl-CoA thioesterase [Ottowia sp. GY511]TXK26845.1 YbgC/FadM family acyl-CoA thioesterase [Ottowia sp. GY511]